MMRDTRKILVISHERSGTHMLINTLAINFGFGEHQIDIDDKNPINWRNSQAMKNFLSSYHEQSPLNIFKSHHPFEFYLPILDYVFSQFRIFYIYRDGRDVMTSFWYFLSRLPWDEGPKCPSVGEFMRHEPSGQCCRYQIQPAVTMLQRWIAHVDNWTGQQNPDLCMIKFEDLCNDFEKTTKELISSFLNIKPLGIIKPKMDHGRAVLPWKGKVGNWKDYFSNDDSTYFNFYAQSLMKRLGYTSEV